MEDGPSSLIEKLYSGQHTKHWEGVRTMEHASGIWGRHKMIGYLQADVIFDHSRIIDLGCGAGFPTFKLAGLTPQGEVTGIDMSEAMLEKACEYKDVRNLKFIHADITKKTPVASRSADVVTSFMVCHNLRLEGLRGMLKESNRILKNKGRAVFLTMHPEALECDWDLDFMRYDREAILKYRTAKVKQGLSIPGIVRNINGREKDVLMIVHTDKNFKAACAEAGFQEVRRLDVRIDEQTAQRVFGKKSVRKIPTTPTFMIVDLIKKKA